MSSVDVIDTIDWQGAGVDTIGAGGFGLLGSEIAASGTNGPGYAYNDLTLPADASKQICGRITTWPAFGTLQAFEDTSFIYTRSGSGSDSFQYQLYVDGVAVGAPQSVALTVGEVAATANGAVLLGTSQIIAGTATGSTTADAIAPGAIVLGTAAILPGTAAGQSSAAAPGCEITGLATMLAGMAEAVTYARAPAGAGHAPQRMATTTRPAAIQRNIR